MTDRLLDGVRVLELAEDVAGPYAGKLLADLGAEVVKVDSKDGDPTRARGPFPTGRVDGAQSSLFHYLNGAKELRRIDLVAPGARDAAEHLPLGRRHAREHGLGSGRAPGPSRRPSRGAQPQAGPCLHLAVRALGASGSVDGQ